MPLRISPARAQFGHGMRILRQKQGLSQEELAHRSGLDRSYIGRVERGELNVSIDNMYFIALALNVGVADVLQVKNAVVAGLSHVSPNE